MAVNYKCFIVFGIKPMRSCENVASCKTSIKMLLIMDFLNFIFLKYYICFPKKVGNRYIQTFMWDLVEMFLCAREYFFNL